MPERRGHSVWTLSFGMASFDPWLDRSHPFNPVGWCSLLTDLCLFALMEELMPHR